MHKSLHSIIFVLVLSTINLSVWAQVIDRVSVSSTGVQANDESNAPSLSADGRFASFVSVASNLVVNDTNNWDDIFAHDRDTGITERINVSSSGVQASSRSYQNTSLSANGRFVAFSSAATNLVTSPNNGRRDVFIRDRETGVTEQVSVSSSGVPANNQSDRASLSADGRFVAFGSTATNLVASDTNDANDIFIHDRNTGVTERISVSSSSVQANDHSFNASFSADGRFVAFQSIASNLVASDTNDVNDIFIHDRNTNVTKRISVSSSGVQANNHSYRASLSGDGQFVAFYSSASNLVANDTNNRNDVFVHNRDTGITQRISVSSSGVQANDKSASSLTSLSADGRFVAFVSVASNLVASDTNDANDIFIHDRNTGVTERVSVFSTGLQGNKHSSNPSLSADGRFVAFASASINLVDNDTNHEPDIFVAENSLIDLGDDLAVTLLRSSGATQVGEYIRFRARLKNNSDAMLTNCKALLVNPPLSNHQREFSYSTWPIKVANPVINGVIDIAPGKTGQFNLAVLPRVAMRREVSFNFVCDNTKAFTIPFINSVHLIAKTEPLIAEDFIQLKNSNKRTELIIDRSNGKYWTPFALKVENTGSEATSINLTTTSNFPGAILRQSQLCEPLDPANGNWSCINPRDTQLQVDLEPSETKKILVFVHAKDPIAKRVIQNRIHLEARDGAGEVVAKTSMGISTIN